MDYQHAPVKKYVYVKQHVMESIKNGHSKVLINPMFMKPPVVHVNPHFKANLTIHINPNILKPPVEPAIVKPSNPITKLPPPNVKPVITANKIIHVATTNTRLKNKYKVVNNVTTAQKHRFKIDNRANTKTAAPKKIKRLVNMPIKNVFVKYNKKLLPSSANGASRKRLINNKVAIKKIGQLLTIGGEKYKIAANKRSLTLLSKKTGRSTNKTVVNLKKNLYVKNNMGKRLLLSQTKHKSTNILKNKLKKSNMSCPFYRRFGKCKGKENGTCIRTHNTDQISLCSKFLQGACLNESCLLSHKVSAEKMPTCRFYLDGLCSKDSCPYLHVKINAKAPICQDFLEGFCKKGAECDKRHQYLCPDFEDSGRCRRKRCQFPHKSVVREKEIPPKLQTEIKNVSKSKSCASSVNKEVPEKTLSVRYYDESLPNMQLQVQTKMDESDQANIDNKEILSGDQPVRKRPTVGDLPSFIPFLASQEPSN